MALIVRFSLISLGRVRASPLSCFFICPVCLPLCHGCFERDFRVISKYRYWNNVEHLKYKMRYFNATRVALRWSQEWRIWTVFLTWKSMNIIIFQIIKTTSQTVQNSSIYFQINVPNFSIFFTCSISDIKLLTKLICSHIKARIWQILLCFLISTGHSHGPGRNQQQLLEQLAIEISSGNLDEKLFVRKLRQDFSRKC